MSEQDKPKRRFWQIHLSTAVVLTIVSSAFLTKNIQNVQFEIASDLNGSGYGWPFPFLVSARLDGWPTFKRMQNPFGPTEFQFGAFSIDLIFFVLIIITIFIIFESIGVSRREGRKT